MPNNNVDTRSGIGYNDNQDDEYAAIAGLDQYEQIVKLDEQKPIHDTECTHEVLVPDTEDTIGDAIYHGCANIKCGRGWYIQK